MPYIKQEDRDKFRGRSKCAQTPGELNYLFTDEIHEYIASQGLSYQTINDILGALEGAKLEFYARVVRPYEDEAIKRNGDVYDPR